jgi:hypothetical protein
VEQKAFHQLSDNMCSVCSAASIAADQQFSIGLITADESVSSVENLLTAAYQLRIAKKQIFKVLKGSILHNLLLLGIRI